MLRLTLPILLVAATAIAADPEPPNYEIFKNIQIAAGRSTFLDSTVDFSSVDRVAVLVRCTVCSTTNKQLDNITFQSYWFVPDSDLPTQTETKLGSAFSAPDSGGFFFQVFGSQLRIVLLNKSNQTVFIQQIVVFRRK